MKSAIAERNPLELDDTTVEEDVVASLRPEDSSYLHPLSGHQGNGKAGAFSGRLEYGS
jgi:hypothetical protein